MHFLSHRRSTKSLLLAVICIIHLFVYDVYLYILTFECFINTRTYSEYT